MKMSETLAAHTGIQISETIGGYVVVWPNGCHMYFVSQSILNFLNVYITFTETVLPLIFYLDFLGISFVSNSFRFSAA